MTNIKNNYVMLHNPESHLADASGMVYEHRQNAEILLGRELLPTEVVHHIDGNKSNNKLSNLMVFATLGDHTAYHKGCVPTQQNDVWVCLDKSIKMNNQRKIICPICHSNLMDIDANMCIKCYREHIAKVASYNQVSKDILSNLITQYPIIQIAKMYNVSDNTIRKWCKHYQLPFKKHTIEAYKNQLQNYSQS